MNKIEEKLRAARCVEPSSSLDKKMEEVFSLKVVDRPSLWRRPVPLWQCLAACVLCVLASSVFMRPEPVAPVESAATAVYMITPSAEGNLYPFDLTQMEHNQLFQKGAVKVIVENPTIPPASMQDSEERKDNNV